MILASIERFASAGPAPNTLQRVARLDITRWSYRSEAPHIAHMGPGAGQFRELFGLGEDDRTISTVDAQGVVLLATQGVLDRIEGLERRLDER